MSAQRLSAGRLSTCRRKSRVRMGKNGDSPHRARGRSLALASIGNANFGPGPWGLGGGMTVVIADPGGRSSATSPAGDPPDSQMGTAKPSYAAIALKSGPDKTYDPTAQFKPFVSGAPYAAVLTAPAKAGTEMDMRRALRVGATKKCPDLDPVAIVNRSDKSITRLEIAVASPEDLENLLALEVTIKGQSIRPVRACYATEAPTVIQLSGLPTLLNTATIREEIQAKFSEIPGGIWQLIIWVDPGFPKAHVGRATVVVSGKQETTKMVPTTIMMSNGDRVVPAFRGALPACNYCKMEGHWASECAKLARRKGILKEVPVAVPEERKERPVEPKPEEEPWQEAKPRPKSARVGLGPPLRIQTPTREGVGIVQNPARTGAVAPIPARVGAVVQLPAKAGAVVQLPAKAGPVVQLPAKAGPVVQLPAKAGTVVQPPAKAGPVVQLPAKAVAVVQLPTKAVAASVPKAAPEVEVPAEQAVEPVRVEDIPYFTVKKARGKRKFEAVTPQSVAPLLKAPRAPEDTKMEEDEWSTEEGPTEKTSEGQVFKVPDMENIFAMDWPEQIGKGRPRRDPQEKKGGQRRGLRRQPHGKAPKSPELWERFELAEAREPLELPKLGRKKQPVRSGEETGVMSTPCPGSKAAAAEVPTA